MGRPHQLRCSKSPRPRCDVHAGLCATQVAGTHLESSNSKMLSFERPPRRRRSLQPGWRLPRRAGPDADPGHRTVQVPAPLAAAAAAVRRHAGAGPGHGAQPGLPAPGSAVESGLAALHTRPQQRVSAGEYRLTKYTLPANTRQQSQARASMTAPGPGLAEACHH